MMTKRWFIRILAAVSVLSLVSLAACDKGEKKSDTSSDKEDGADKPDGKKVVADDKDKKAPSAEESAPSKTGFAVFPADSEMVFSISGTSLRKSSLWSRFKGPLTGPLYASADWKEFSKVCKLNPIEEIESVLVGGRPQNEDKLIMVIKGLSKAEIKDCAAKIEKHDNSMKMSEDGNLMHLKVPNEDIYLHWLDDNTFLTATNVSDKAYIGERGTGKNGLDSNQAFTKILENVDSNATVWFAVVPAADSEMGRSMANVPGGGPTGLFGSVLLEGGLGLDLGARFASEDQAKSMHEMGSKQLPGVKAQVGPMGKYIDKVQMSQKGTDVLIQAKLDQKELDALMGDLDKALGGFDKMIKSAM